MVITRPLSSRLSGASGPLSAGLRRLARSSWVTSGGAGASSEIEETLAGRLRLERIWPTKKTTDYGRRRSAPYHVSQEIPFGGTSVTIAGSVWRCG
jgi:hypothetical protein